MTFAFVFQEWGLISVGPVAFVTRHGPVRSVSKSDFNGVNMLAVFHQDTKCGGASRTSVCPEYKIIRVRIAPTLEKIEEQVTSSHVDESGIGTVLYEKQTMSTR